jgi:flagellar biosynthesis protein FlhB
MPEQSGDKTQDATPHRRQQAREQGQVARSQDLGSAAVLVGGLVTLYALFDRLGGLMLELVREHLAGPAWVSADAGFVTSLAVRLLLVIGAALLPILGLMTLAALVASLMQVGLMWAPEMLTPDLSRIDPLKGLGRLFSLSSVARLFFGMIKIAIVAGVAYAALRAESGAILSLVERSLEEIGPMMLELLYWTALKIGLTLLVLALFDYGFQWWKHEQDLRMTTQEVREEMRNLQGDPQIISRRRAVQRQLMLSRMGQSVPKADVVVTNPTELAVAIQYAPETMAAPIVVAKGAGVMAQRIRRLALENGIPIVEKKPLAQALYREVEVNHPIPAERYGAVAEVLAYVYQLKGKTLPGRP